MKDGMTRGGSNLLLNAMVLEEYEKFKINNELIYCSCKQTTIEDTHIKTTFSTTRKYREFDLDLIKKDFLDFINTNGETDNCSITKITNQEHAHIVEFSVFKTFVLCI